MRIDGSLFFGTRHLGTLLGTHLGTHLGTRHARTVDALSVVLLDDTDGPTSEDSLPTGNGDTFGEAARRLDFG